jgi:hypothetical protein
MLLDFLELSSRLGNSASEFWSHFLLYQRNINHSIHLLKWFTGELPEVSDKFMAHKPLYLLFPEIAFVLVMAQSSANLPMALAAFTLIQSAAKNLRLNLSSIFQQTGDFASQLSNLRAIYAVSEIKNQIIDGTEKLDPNCEGISLEFMLVLAFIPPRALPHNFSGTFLSNIPAARAMLCTVCHSKFNKVNYV